MDDFIVRAVLGGLGVAVVAGPLGSCVVWARMAFFGEAIAHAALLGVALGLLLGVNPTLAVVAFAALVGVALVGLQGQRTVAADTLLGILAHGALAAGLVAIALMETVRIDLMGYLFGDILALSAAEVFAIWGVAFAALAVLPWLWRPLLSLMVHEELARVEGVPATGVRLAFMLLIALVVALAIKVVGLLLVTALLVMPAAAARRFARTPEQMAVLASAIGCLSVVLGMGGSFAWDTPSGPSIVVAAAAAFAVSRLWPRLRPRRSG